MITIKEVINWAKDLADKGLGWDQDGVYGTQCVDLPNGVSVQFFGKYLGGNAIDLLESAKRLGYTVEYNIAGDLDSRPRAGAFFVMEVAGHGYGHTGLVTKDSDGYTMNTIEQNIDGNWDALYRGAPARYHERDFTGVVGWFYPPYDNDDAVYNGLMRLDRPRKFTVTADKLNVRNEPSTNSEIVAVYEKGESFIYTEFIYTDDFEWLSYISNSGKRRYVASEDLLTHQVFGEWSYAE